MKKNTLIVRRSATKEPVRNKKPASPSIARLNELIQAAIVDAYGEEEQIVGFHCMLEDNLATPFKTEMLGVEVTVEFLDTTDDNQIVAVCTRGKHKQRVPILDLPLPDPEPEGAEWIHAYRRFRHGG